MLYMAERYGADVRMTRRELTDWHRADPLDDWEVERARRIEARTGLKNPYITRNSGISTEAGRMCQRRRRNAPLAEQHRWYVSVWPSSSNMHCQ